MLATVPAVAVKLPLVAAAGTLRLAGTVTAVLLLLKATLRPPLGAAALKLTLQLLVPGPVNNVGVHVRLLTVTGTATTPPVAEVAIGTAV